MPKSGIDPKVLDAITAICGPSGLLTGNDVTARASNWRGTENCQAGAIARPANSGQVSEILKVCHSFQVPVIGAGGLTGTVHGTDATPDQLLISFERMNAIESIDLDGRCITVQAGAPMQKVQEIARKNGLLFGVDLGARGSATIGGNISTNAGGNQVLRYGMMREQVLGLEAVLSDGTIVSSMNTLLKNNAGYDLKQLFVGTEGTLGLVTRAVLRLHSQPRSENTALLAFSDFSTLTKCFRALAREFGSDLTAFEVMWQEHYRIVAVQSGRHAAPLPDTHAIYAIVDYCGMEPERDASMFERVLGDMIEAGHIADAVLSNSHEQRERLWAIREDLEGLVHSLAPAVGFDVGLPITHMEAYIRQVQSDLTDAFPEGSRSVFFGHLGDGNLHVIVAPRPWSEDAREIVEGVVYRPLQAIGGTISAEHGIGLEKKRWLHLSRTPAEIALMKVLKSTLDPHNLLNRGKIF